MIQILAQRTKDQSAHRSQEKVSPF
jgi:hypothetical protein